MDWTGGIVRSAAGAAPIVKNGTAGIIFGGKCTVKGNTANENGIVTFISSASVILANTANQNGLIGIDAGDGSLSASSGRLQT